MRLTQVHNDVFIAEISRHERLVYKVCNMFTADMEDKKDLFQEIILQAWSAYPRYQGNASFGTWLYRIALNTAISHKRRSGSRRITSHEDMNLLEIPEEVSAEDDAYKAMQQLISALPAMEKALVMLYMDDYSYHEIADILGISATNVGTKLGRIREKLKKQAGNH